MRIVREHGAKPLMLSFWPADSDHPHAVVVPQVADALDAPTVVYHGPRFDIVHPTAQGYEWLAGEILEVLERLGYVGDGDGGAHHPRS